MQRSSLKLGSWEHERLHCLPGIWKVREEKTSVDAKDPCVEWEVEGTC